MAGRARIVDRGREPAVVLEAGSARATFLPGAGVLGVSLVHDDTLTTRIRRRPRFTPVDRRAVRERA
jgi:hypothetical protein